MSGDGVGAAGGVSGYGIAVLARAPGRLTPLYPDPRRLVPPRVKRHDGQGRSGPPPPGPGEPGPGEPGPGETGMGEGEAGDSGACERCLGDVVAAARGYRTVPRAYPHPHVGEHHAIGAEPLDLAFQPTPGVVPGPVDQFRPAGDLGVAHPPSSLAGGRPVIVPGTDRDAERESHRDPARRDQLGEILPGYIAGEGCSLPGRDTRRAHRGAYRRELQPAEGE